MDIVEDVWRKIFGLLQTTELAKLMLVCKRWREILQTPEWWKSIEWRQVQEVAESKLVSTTKSFMDFLFRYCQSIEDLILQIRLGEGSQDFLYQLFQIKSLRRVSLDIRAKDHIDLPVTQAPLCKDLRLLNIRVNALHNLKIDGCEGLFSALSNIEELYVNFEVNSLIEILAGLKKLKRFGLPVGMATQALLGTVSHLKLLLLSSKSYNEPTSIKARMFEGTLAVVQQNNEGGSETNGYFPLISPFLDPIEDSDLILNPALSKDNLTYLVKERGFDINYVISSQSKFRPIMFRANSNREYALKSAVMDGAVDRISLLISLGADPNSPLEDDSPLLHATSDAIYDHLLNLGSDPNKLVKGIPVFMYLLLVPSTSTILAFTSAQTDFSLEKILTSLIGRCDFNKKYRGLSFVDLALSSQSPSEALSVLREKNLVTWTPDQLDILLNTKQAEFYRIIYQPGFDLDSLKMVTLVKAAERLPSQVLLDALMNQKNYQKDADGFTFVHYLALINSTTYGAWKPTVKKPEVPSPQRWSSATSLQPTNIFLNILDQLLTPVEDNPSTETQPTTVFDQPITATQMDLEEFFSSVPSNNVSSNQPGKSNADSQQLLDMLAGSNSGILYSMLKEPIPTDTLEELIIRHKDAINHRSEFGETPLLVLCKSSALGEVKCRNTQLLLKYGADVNLADNHGWTPLHAALYSSDWTLAELLLSHGANVNAQDEMGVTPVMAWFYGDGSRKDESSTLTYNKTLKILDQKGVDLTLTDKFFNRSVIHLLACAASPILLDTVLKNASSHVILEARDNDGFTPLHHAALFCNYDMVSYLIKCGANVNAQSYALKLTPLMILFAINNNVTLDYSTQWLTHCNTLMLSSPIETSIPASSRTRTTAHTYFSVIEPSWTARNRSNGSYVADQQYIRVCHNNKSKFDWRVFLPSADLSLTDSLGNTLLHTVVMSRGKQLLTTMTAKSNEWQELNFLWSHCNANGDTPLHLLLDSCKELDGSSAAKLIRLIEIGNVNLNLANNKGETCMQRMLLLRSLSLHEKNQVLSIAKKVPHAQSVIHKQIGSTTILHSILQVPDASVNLELLKSCLTAQNTSDINVRDEDGNTPLMVLLRHVFISSCPMIYTTLTRKTRPSPPPPPPNEYFGFGQSLQIENDEKDIYDSINLWPIVDYLISCPGADLNMQNNSGDTALHIVCRQFHVGALEAMLCNLNTFEQASKYCLIAFKLLDGGAQVTIKNNAGETAIDYAPMLMSHYQHIYPLIKQHVAVAGLSPQSIPDTRRTAHVGYDLSVFEPLN